MNDEDIQRKLNELAKNSDVMIASPDTIANLQGRMSGFSSKFETYQEYLDKLFAEKRAASYDLLNQLPDLDPIIANPTASALYEEVRQCAVMGIPGATITQAVILLEHAARHRLWEMRLESDPHARWEDVELLNLGDCVKELKKKGVINKSESKRLVDFNENVRNPYLHYNIKRLLTIEGVTITELPSINVKTGETTILKDVSVPDMPQLCFSAKRVMDKVAWRIKAEFVMHWVNTFLCHD